MDRSVKLGHLLLAVFSLAITLITAFVSIKVTDGQQDIEINNLKANKLELINLYEKVNLKLDQIQNSQTQILIQLQDKQDRPK